MGGSSVLDMPESPLNVRQRVLKRGLDVTASLFGLVLLFPVIIVAFLVTTVDARHSGIFVQWRVGRGGRLFPLLKIRTMRVGESQSPVTVEGDRRMTWSGRWLRRWKIDELPQLVNVLLGHMSLVGPRPDVPGFADQLAGEVRPGITGPASLVYRYEECLLSGVEDPEEYNLRVVFPDKVRINLHYIRNYTFREDLRMIWLTLTGRELNRYP